MLAYTIRKILYAFPILFGVCLLTFVTFYCVTPPRQMARRYLGKAPSQQQIDGWLRAHGYDRPLPEQFVKHTTELFRFRFGKSDANGEPVGRLIRSGAGPSLMLAIPEFFAAAYVTIALALFQAYFRRTYIDTWTSVLCVGLMSVNLLLYVVAGQFIFAKLMRIFPLAGYAHGAEGARFVALPLVVGLLSGLGGTTRYYRAVFAEEVHQDYVRTARSRGIPESRILFAHVLKNAASPILTSLVLSIPFLFLGNLLMEKFFGIPGLGSITVDAIDAADFSLVRAVVFIGTVAYIVGSILTDISYALVNPRVRLE